MKEILLQVPVGQLSKQKYDTQWTHHFVKTIHRV